MIIPYRTIWIWIWLEGDDEDVDWRMVIGVDRWVDGWMMWMMWMLYEDEWSSVLYCTVLYAIIRVLWRYLSKPLQRLMLDFLWCFDGGCYSTNWGEFMSGNTYWLYRVSEWYGMVWYVMWVQQLDANGDLKFGPCPALNFGSSFLFQISVLLKKKVLIIVQKHAAR